MSHHSRVASARMRCTQIGARGRSRLFDGSFVSVIDSLIYRQTHGLNRLTNTAFLLLSIDRLHCLYNACRGYGYPRIYQRMYPWIFLHHFIRVVLSTRNTFYGTRYLSHCYARFAFNPLFVNWVTSLTPRVT